MKQFKLLLIALCGLFLASCVPSEKPTFYLHDLQGLWLENGDTKVGHYVRFTTEQSDENPYLYGREWTESEWDDPDMTFEEFLIWNREKIGHPGNGWFKYLFESDDQKLTEIHLMDIGPAEQPKIYTVTKLSSTTLEYYDKDHVNNATYRHSYEKITEK
jgi:hypothetical protein